jgi:hypothetical protein
MYIYPLQDNTEKQVSSFGVASVSTRSWHNASAMQRTLQGKGGRCLWYGPCRPSRILNDGSHFSTLGPQNTTFTPSLHLWRHRYPRRQVLRTQCAARLVGALGPLPRATLVRALRQKEVRFTSSQNPYGLLKMCLRFSCWTAPGIDHSVTSFVHCAE